MFDLDNILRKNIANLTPYSSARDEYKGKEGIFLDANENSYGSPLNENYNRYPDPMQLSLKEKISKIKGLPVENIFLGNGSDEAIDILFRSAARVYGPRVTGVLLSGSDDDGALGLSAILEAGGMAIVQSPVPSAGLCRCGPGKRGLTHAATRVPCSLQRPDQECLQWHPW